MGGCCCIGSYTVAANTTNGVGIKEGGGAAKKGDVRVGEDGLNTLTQLGNNLCHTLAGLYVAIALVGFGNSNIFSMVFSKALLYLPEKNNEMSGLMIMGLIGGTIFPLLMGVLSDAMGTQAGSVIVISVGVAYLVYLAFKFLKKATA